MGWSFWCKSEKEKHICTICNKQMIVGEAYYTDENLKPQHAMCVWDEEEKRKNEKGNLLEDQSNGGDSDFQPCDECDLPDACYDFGCAIKSGVRI